ncbi:hypothetical protein [Streptomyces sp. NPDC001054]
MTRDKRRKRKVRATQEATGARYVVADRQVARAREQGGEFLLRDLLAAYVAGPRPREEDAAPHGGGMPDDAPEAARLAALLPYGTVLELAVALMRDGLGARLRVESAGKGEEPSPVVVCGVRRFELVSTQDMCTELCRRPGCPQRPAAWLLTHCAGHLALCPPGDLRSMAREWAFARWDSHHHVTAALGGSDEADALVRAAVAHAAADGVVTELLDGCYETPETVDEIEMADPVRAADLRAARARERERLGEVARREFTRLREDAASCTTCGTPLAPVAAFGMRGCPPAYCSAACAPPSTPTAHEQAAARSRERNPWTGPPAMDYSASPPF